MQSVVEILVFCCFFCSEILLESQKRIF